MKKGKRTAVAVAEPPPPNRSSDFAFRRVALVLAAAIALGLVAYAPALAGPFVFDDIYLPYCRPGIEGQPLSAWVDITRPISMISFWLNYQLSGERTVSYHVLNVLLHACNALLIWLAVRRLSLRVGMAGRAVDFLPLFAAAVFLLHPIQTESVAYVASRTEVLSTLFFYAAFLWFLLRRDDGLGLGSALGILLLFGAAVLSKEHAAVLPALLLLTDLFWSGVAGVRKNWRLYAPIVVAGAAGVFLIARVMMTANTAGFALKDLKWYEYLFTQFRVIWIYLRLFVLPAGFNIDHDVPVSRSLFEPGAVLGLCGLLGVTGWLWFYRRRFPLAAYGWLAFLLLLAPTSSFMPIRDVIAERRFYLPMFGLLLVVVDFLARVPVTRIAVPLALAPLILAGLTWQRSHVWSGSVPLWEDVVVKSPNKYRPHFQLAYAYYHEGRCADAVRHYERAAALQQPNYELLIDSALALDCAAKPDEAIAKLTHAAKLEHTAHAYSLMGMVYGKQGRNQDALEAIEKALKLDANYAMAYVYRGNVYYAAGEVDQAGADFKRALAIDPGNQAARAGLAAIARRPRR